MHPGYNHIHKVIHMEPMSISTGYPMLFSERCDCTLQALPFCYFASALCVPWVDAARQLLSGLEYMASRGVCHEDIKRDNVLCTLQPGTGLYHYVFTDFGLSERRNDDEAFKSDLASLTRMLRALPDNVASQGLTFRACLGDFNGKQASFPSLLCELKGAIAADLGWDVHLKGCLT